MTESEVLEHRKERAEAVDYKMVTFSLAGKDYGVDIMNVKEIAKAGKFTFVPNAATFLRGVYNLRGEIIPVIDLRVFFHLPAEKKEEDALENTLILRIGEQVLGVIVDNIDKVVGITSSSIQPPHPIFGDINIKYIRGVVENQGRLYIILDAIRIFSPKEEEKHTITESPAVSFAAPEVITQAVSSPERQSAASSDLGFIKETLSAFRKFSATEFNDEWVSARFEEWKAQKKGKDLQLKDAEDADAYLAGFFSPFSGAFWSDEYANAVFAILPDLPSKNINVWNPGCGKGHETYSFACILRNRYPEAHLKIWANDADLLSISTAPNMVFDLEDVPEFCREYMVKGRNGYGFNQTIRDSVVFEYHDVLNANPYPELDIILARDLISFLTPGDQSRVFADFSDKLKRQGVLFLGRNEKPPLSDEWKPIGNELVSAYARAE
ncbi:MAG: CheR family methyltransferase [Treponemataceae bacterium]